MSNIIQLLEKMGADASLQQQDSVTLRIDHSELSDELKQTLFNRDAQALESQLDGCPAIICSSIALPEEEPNDVPAEDQPEESEPENRRVANG